MVTTGDEVISQEMTQLMTDVLYAAPPSTLLEEAELLKKCKRAIDAVQKLEIALSWQVKILTHFVEFCFLDVCLLF